MKDKLKNKGFTLVELIVVVVILAIIIGVAITGIYRYVNEARMNVDINDTDSIQKMLYIADIEMNTQEKEWFKEYVETRKPAEYKLNGLASAEHYNYAGLYWNEEMTLDEAIDYTLNEFDINWNWIFENIPSLDKHLRSLFTDKMPKSKSSYAMGFAIGFDNQDSFKAYCTALDENFIIQNGTQKGEIVDAYIEKTFRKVTY